FLPRRLLHACLSAIASVNWGLAYVLAKKPFRFLLNLGIRFMTMLLLFAAFMCGSTDVTLAAAQPVLIKSATSTGSAEQVSPAGMSPRQEEQGLSAKAVEIFRPYNFPITNSMVVSWFVALSLILFAQFATRKMQRIPAGAQNLLEWLVEGLYKFLVGIIGPHLAGRTFWFFATIFTFILSANWVGLVPGVGTIGWGHQTSHGFTIDQPWLRGANADVNMTLAMALVFFACWIVWAFL